MSLRSDDASDASEAFPWTRFLPPEDRRAFVVELMEVRRAVESLDQPNPALLAQLIAAWQHTAEIHADPELLALATQEIDDLGPVMPAHWFGSLGVGHGTADLATSAKAVAPHEPGEGREPA